MLLHLFEINISLTLHLFKINISLILHLFKINVDAKVCFLFDFPKIKVIKKLKVWHIIGNSNYLQIPLLLLLRKNNIRLQK